MQSRGKKYLQVVIDFRDRSYGRAGCLDRILLFDRNRRRDSADRIDLRFVHPVKELPGVGGKGFDVASLPFGIESLESEARFSRAARPCHDSEFPNRNIDIDTLEVVLPRSTNFDLRVGKGSCLSGALRHERVVSRGYVGRRASHWKKRKKVSERMGEYELGTTASNPIAENKPRW